jgi:PAT family beta-lactamase induction signal transducer AmpG
MSTPSPGAGPAPARSWRAALAVYLERRILLILCLGFSGGLPLALVYATLSARLAESGVSKTAIGLFVWASTAYTLKFLWSPLVDRLALPVLTRAFGQRRGWLLASQAAVAAAIIGLGLSDPALSLAAVAAWAVALAFASATQDIVIDAYRVESLAEHEQGAGAAAYVFGYRIAMAVSGGGALIVADILGWAWAFGVMAACMAVGVGATLAAREPTLPDDTESAADGGGAWAWIERAVLAPFLDFIGRPHWIAILVFIAFYKYGDALLGVMATPFYLDLGFSKTDIGWVSKVFGIAATIAGGILGGVAVARYGIMQALIIGGVAQAASNLVFMAQASIGPSVPFLVVTVGIENATGGMATTAFIAYLSALCTVHYTATQYALLSSLMAFARTGFSSAGGWLADRMDWIAYFGLTTLAAVPGLLLLVYLARRAPPRYGAPQHEAR